MIPRTNPSPPRAEPDGASPPRQVWGGQLGPPGQLLRNNPKPPVPVLAGRKTSNLQLKQLFFFLSKTFIVCYIPVGPYGSGGSQHPAPTNRPTC